jgi:mono/diheme cytochrome c family protein
MKKILKLLAGILVGLAGILVIGGIAIVILFDSKMNKKYDVPVTTTQVSTDPAVIQRGKHLAENISVCIDCHGLNLEGGVLVDDPLLGVSIAPNLTKGKGGIGGLRSDQDLSKIIRYGVFPDGRSVTAMPSQDYIHLSDADLTAIISYIRSKPAVDSNLPASEWRVIGKVVVALGMLDFRSAENINPGAVQAQAPQAGVSVEYGHYLANIAGCTGCHGPGLSGGVIPGTPPDYPQASNLTPGGSVGLWSEAQFIQTIRTGKNPGGKEINKIMPTRLFAGMTDDELKAIWLFMKSAPAKEFGNR